MAISRDYFKKKKGKITPAEDKVCQEIDTIINRANESNNQDIIDLFNDSDTTENLDELFSLRDALRDMESISPNAAITDEPQAKFSEKINNSFTNAPMSKTETTANLSDLGDLDAVPETNQAPQVKEQVKERIYNTVDNNTVTSAQPVSLPEDTQAFSGTSTSSLDAEELPPGVGQQTTPPLSGEATPIGSTPINAAPTGFTPPPKAPPVQPLNPVFNDLDNKEKRQAAEQMVDTALSAYEQAHRLFVWMATVPEDKLLAMQFEGKIDLTVPIPISETQEKPLIEFIRDYNSQAKDTLTYEKSFGDTVRPAMIRVFMKHGWGMSDEQWLMYKFSEDIATKVALCVGMKKGIMSAIELYSKGFIYEKNQAVEKLASTQSVPRQTEKETPPAEFTGKSNFSTEDDKTTSSPIDVEYIYVKK